MARGKSVCIFGTKGGLGKTTFVLNLAGVLSNLKKKVLIVDLDLANGGIAVSLDKVPNKTIFNFCDDYNNNRNDNMENYITKYNEYIDFLASPKDPRQANKIDAKYIDILIDKCSFLYDVILIDTNHNYDEINISALDKADEIFLMTTNDPLAFKNIRNLINILQDLEINKYKLILNNSVISDKNYFSKYDIKNILGVNIDYTISEKFHLKKIDAITLAGEIPTIKDQKYDDYNIFELIASSLVVGDGQNE